MTERTAVTGGAAVDPGPAGHGPGEVLAREAVRVSDRLRVLGPRWAGRDRDSDAPVLAAVRGALQRLADLSADAEGRPRRQVPVLAPYALGDQVLVLAHEAGAAGPTAEAAAHQTLARLRHLL